MNDQHYQHTTDQQLLNSFYETGNTKLLGILLQRYTLLLLGVCMKYLKNEEAAKDAVQQIFLKVINELKRYKVNYFKSWLYMIAKNHCLMQLRNKHYNTLPVEDNNFLVDEEQFLAQHADKERILSVLESSVEELNKEQKICIYLFYLQKKTYKAISEQTGYTIMQVKSFIQNGKRNLRMLVEKKMKQK